tara:strand:- start:506 stop:694 length:189 start_codon:yes stop_codon:yes gene_type:complete
MKFLKTLLPLFIILPGCIKKKEASQPHTMVIRDILDLPSDEDLEEDTSIPECGEEVDDKEGK